MNYPTINLNSDKKKRKNSVYQTNEVLKSSIICAGIGALSGFLIGYKTEKNVLISTGVGAISAGLIGYIIISN
jgi:energy-converting hydrogenase Eha subunit A